MYAVHRVADDHGDEHRTYVRGEGQARQRREPRADLIADADGQQEQHKALDKAGAVGDETLVLARHIGGKARALRFAADRDRLGVQVVLFDQALGCRAAHQRAGHQTERRRRDGNDTAAHRTRGLKVRPKGRRCTGTADEGDGAAADAQQRIAAEHLHHPAAEEVLQRDHHDGDDQAQHHGLAALEQRRDADRKADRGEEQDHENGLQCAVKGDGRDAGGVENAVENGKAQSADQRSGDTISVEQSHLVGDDPAHPEQEST